MTRRAPHFALAALGLLTLGGCAPHFSPNVYASNAVQLANKVEAGSVIGYREVAISANGSIGAVTGGAVGGVLGAEYAKSALAAVSGTAVGGMLGGALEHAARDTTGWEYIIRKANGDMLSVTQREQVPLDLGQRVLVIMGPQARVVPDYSMPHEPKVAAIVPPAPPPQPKPEPVKVEVVLSLPPGVAVQQPPATAPEPTTHDSMPAPAKSFEEHVLEGLSLATPLAQALALTEGAATATTDPSPARERAPDTAATPSE